MVELGHSMKTCALLGKETWNPFVTIIIIIIIIIIIRVVEQLLCANQLK